MKHEKSQLGGIKGYIGNIEVHLKQYGCIGTFLRLGVKVWHCQVYDEDFNVGNGESKNKFTAYRLALESLHEDKYRRYLRMETYRADKKSSKKR